MSSYSSINSLSQTLSTAIQHENISVLCDYFRLSNLTKNGRGSSQLIIPNTNILRKKLKAPWDQIVFLHSNSIELLLQNQISLSYEAQIKTFQEFLKEFSKLKAWILPLIAIDVSPLPDFEEFPLCDKVEYNFNIGVLAFLQQDYLKASKHLSYSLAHIPAKATKNRIISDSLEYGEWENSTGQVIRKIQGFRKHLSSFFISIHGWELETV
ncbi:hypothetical protein BB560_001370 [Smittium megazygosporum]|uniref:Uncharacterized protein n=1 Tax=Smittium megazygosporum TaxID=133381 RepID=A0A2T9ZHQ0_9FUNG|nr:hypothetical protein BB560_001370 [Smittium megazygosporum]